MAGRGEEPVPIGCCEVLNSAMLQLSIDLAPLGLPSHIGQKCAAMVLSTYSRNPPQKHACIQILIENGVEFPRIPTMYIHRGDGEGLKRALQQDPSLLHRQFSEAEIYPQELGIQPGDGLHLTPLAGCTLLHMAVAYKELEGASILLQAGMNPNSSVKIDRMGKRGVYALVFHTVGGVSPTLQQSCAFVTGKWSESKDSGHIYPATSLYGRSRLGKTHDLSRGKSSGICPAVPLKILG